MARLWAKSPTSYEPKLSISPRCVPRKIGCRSPLGPMSVASAGGRRVLGPVQQSAALEMAWKWVGYLIFYSGYQTLFFLGQKQLGHTLWNFTALLAEVVVLGDRGLEFSGHVDDLGIISSLSHLGLSKYTKLQWLVITLMALFGARSAISISMFQPCLIWLVKSKFQGFPLNFAFNHSIEPRTCPLNKSDPGCDIMQLPHFSANSLFNSCLKSPFYHILSIFVG